MAKKNKKDGQTNLLKSPKSPLRPLALVAAISTLVFVLLDVGTFVTYILYHFCFTQLAPLHEFTIGAIFFSNYISDSCSYTDGTKVVVNWLNPVGENFPPLPSLTHPYTVTNGDSTLIWMIVGLILDLIWFVTTIPLYSKKRQLTKINSTFYPWLSLTTLVLIFQLIATCFYGLELQTYMDLLKTNLEGLENTVMNQLVAILIIPLFFSKGVLFWLYFFILHVIGYVKVGKAKKNLLKAPTMFGNNSHNGKSLDDEGTQVLNRRALGLSNGHNQDDFSDDEGGDNPYSKNFSNVLQQASERRTSENWMFANDAFEPEYMAPMNYSESVLRSNQPGRNFTNPYMVSSVPGYVVAQPSTQNTGNPNQPPLSIQESLDIKLRNRPRQLSDAYMSDVDSVASEYDRDHRRLGRPVIPERDYPLPRAHSKKSKGARPIIRTPSGKYSSASEYLRGYAPQEAPVMEEDYDHQERYYVKLKD